MGGVIGEKFIENDTGNIASTSANVEPMLPAVLTGNSTDPSEVKVASSDSQIVSGVFIESGLPSGEATYCKLGIVRVKVKGVVAVNDRLNLASDPKFFTKVTTGYSFGRAKTPASADGDVVYMEIEPMYL